MMKILPRGNSIPRFLAVSLSRTSSTTVINDQTAASFGSLERNINTYLQKLKNVNSGLSMRRKKEIEKTLTETSVWDDARAAAELSHELALIERKLNDACELDQSLADVVEMYQLAYSEKDSILIDECMKTISRLNDEVAKKETLQLMSQLHDNLSCYVQINAGVGGTESCDWVLMLWKMYELWAPKQQFRISIVDERPNDEGGAGYRSITLKVVGDKAYGWIRAEAGVHRLVRISPFDPQKKRHTSFAQVLVYPDFPEDGNDKQNEINPKDLRIDTYRASGAGGQHVNKTDSAVRITHFPTGIVVSCQNGRSQHSNKATAMSVLRSRIQHLEKVKEYTERQQNTIGVGDVSWGNQIRSVVMQPYQIVKDHRTGWESGNIGAFLAGESLSDAIMEYHRWNSNTSCSEKENPLHL